MVIGDFYIISVTVSPDKADSVLIVDANAVLAFPVSRQRFEMIAWEDCKVAQLTRAVQLHQLSLGNSSDVLKSANALAVKERLSFFAAKRAYHSCTESCEEMRAGTHALPSLTLTITTVPTEITSTRML